MKQKIEDIIIESVTNKEISCKHKPYCTEKHKYSMRCIFGQNECEAKKFYDNYGDYENHLGVGSMM